MPDWIARRILDHLADTRYEPSTARELARDLGLDDQLLPHFRAALDQLLEDGQVLAGASDTIGLPPPGREVVGSFRLHERGFGFLIPDELTQHGDLFVPPGDTSNARTGDRVRAKVHRVKGRAGGGRSPYVAEIVEVIERADRHYAGTLVKQGKRYVVEVDGKALHDPVLIRDPHAKNANPGDKVVIDLLEQRREGKPLEGVIIEVLGEAGLPDVETEAVMRAFNLPGPFDKEVIDQARKSAADNYDADAIPDGREDLTDILTLTIDPPDARDFDDAISIRKVEPGSVDDIHPKACWELGVHIADVSHFVKPGSALDAEAYVRGNSTYLPRRVLPMLPELLSNGVCSLQEGVLRYTKTCLITFDAKGKPLTQRFTSACIRSDKRLTYLEAQALIDDDIRKARKHTKSEAKYPRPIMAALKHMDELARVIRKRRLDAGMIVLGLPSAELVFDDAGRVVDAKPEDDAFTHTIIEMFMVEANEAAARLFVNLNVPMIRRVHPDPDAHNVGELRQFARVAGYSIPLRPSRRELQALLDQVRGKPAQHAVHLAVLKTLSKAEYAPVLVGHFALASEHYTHFTSPIRRYPDLIVHRGLERVITNVNKGDHNWQHAKVADLNEPMEQLKRLSQDLTDDPALPNDQKLREIGKHCSTTERNSEQAERDLRTYLVLELLSEHLGDDFEGTVTGATASGIFVELDKFLTDGFIRISELPTASGDRWKFNRQAGTLVTQRSGRAIGIGHRCTVRIARIDLARRQLDLVLIEKQSQSAKKRKRRQPLGAAKAHTKTRRLKQKQRTSRSRNPRDKGKGGKRER